MLFLKRLRHLAKGRAEASLFSLRESCGILLLKLFGGSFIAKG